MGAWDCGIFDDDTAVDVLEELIDSEDIVGDMRKYFSNAQNEEYLEYPFRLLS